MLRLRLLMRLGLLGPMVRLARYAAADEPSSELRLRETKRVPVTSQ